MMFGPLVLLAASVSPAIAPAPQVAEPTAAARATIRASAQASVTIRIISAARFGPGQPGNAPGADRRSTLLADASGAPRPAELLEFQ